MKRFFRELWQWIQIAVVAVGMVAMVVGLGYLYFEGYRECIAKNGWYLCNK